MKMSESAFDDEVHKILRSPRVRMMRVKGIRHLAYAYNGIRLWYARRLVRERFRRRTH